MMPNLIGISGYATAGKDSVADYLVREHGYVKVGWADKLRAAAMALNPIVGWEDGGCVRYADVVETMGYNNAKADVTYGREIRRTLIRLGTEVGRDVFSPNFWVDILLGSLEPGRRYVISDTRFPNEAEAVRGKCGAVWRVTRPGVRPVADHPSETALDGWDFDLTIYNEGSLADLHRWLKLVLKEEAA